MRRSRRLGALAAVLVAAGCSGEAGSPSATRVAEATPSTTEPTTSTTIDEAAAVEAAYLAWEAAYRLATADPVTPNLPALQELMAGEARTVVTRNLEARAARGEAVRPGGRAESRIDVLEVIVRASSAVVEICEVDDSIVYVVGSGEVVNDDVWTSRRRIALERQDGRWKITSSEELERRAGALPCG